MKIIKGTNKVKENKSRNWLNNQKTRFILGVYGLVVIPSNRAFASGTATADKKWSDIIDFILGWVQKLGGGLLLFGAIEIALSFIQNDPGQRSTGIKFALAGCMVIAIGFSKSLFTF